MVCKGKMTKSGLDQAGHVRRVHEQFKKNLNDWVPRGPETDKLDAWYGKIKEFAQDALWGPDGEWDEDCASESGEEEDEEEEDEEEEDEEEEDEEEESGEEEGDEVDSP